MFSDKQWVKAIHIRSDSKCEIDNRRGCYSITSKFQNRINKMQRLLELATNKAIQLRSIRIGFVVGLVLNGINQGPEFITGTDFNNFKALLTFVVPYCVATYSAVSVSLNNASDKASKR